ncbi:hypothetical protein BGZ54_005606 [Gamsiella multidivaricata]|nr:hypothetical protein BGZ54_005606 [Gamsiella multidivaricata]
MLHAHANGSHYHEQQRQHPRDFVEQASPPMSSPAYQRPMNPPHREHHRSSIGSTNNSNFDNDSGSNSHYRSHSSQHPQQQQHQHHHQQQHQYQHQQQHQHQHQHQHQDQYQYQSQSHGMRSQPQPHQQNYSHQPTYHSSHTHASHHHPSSPPAQDEYPSKHYQAIPIIQSSDPSFTQRPHARSFSGTHSSHPYSQYPASPSIPSGLQQQHQPRLHHSTSAGHLPGPGHRSAPIVVSSATSTSTSKQGAAAGTGAAPKKKDPYATAWRTYSKIAEELNLLNPDGTLYPISKEAILKYLHHQSKRIKSSNLHWYVNGLKKHQENLGFAWDDVRYDEQVVALLKELTLHPVTIDSSGGGSGGSTVYHSSVHPPRHSMPIDTSKIASLSISSNAHSQSYREQSSQQYQHQHHSHHGVQDASFGVGSKRHFSQPHQYEAPPTHSRQHHVYTERVQPSPPSHSSGRVAPFHSAPIQLPSQHVQDDRSSHDIPPTRYKSHSHALGEISPAASTSTTSSPMSSSEIQMVQQSPPSNSNGSHVKRKRHEIGHERMTRLISPTSAEGEELDESEINARVAEDLEGRALEDMDEDHRETIALKRHASTGTLRIQARVSAMTAMSPDNHLYQREYPVSPPSPVARENESSSHFRWGSSEAAAQQSRLSPPSASVSSIGSTSPASRSTVGSSVLTSPVSSGSSYRHRRANGVVSSPISSVTAGGASSVLTSTTAITGTALGTSSTAPSNKTMVQFSEVVDYAQELQTKYGNRCKDHPWGCVELSEDFHLELTIKMYMDWAGLVASGRLTMDEIPDLPDFRQPGATHLDPSSLSPTPGPSAVLGGTLKRMTSTPLTTTFGSFSQRHQPSRITSPPLKSEDQSPTGSPGPISGPFTFGHPSSRARSPSSSPIYGQSPREGYISDSLMSRIGSPPPQHTIPSPPPMTVTKQSSSGATSASSAAAAATAATNRARARKMASSPSLGQHASFQRFGFSSPPLPPMPPLPSLSKPDQRERDGRLARGPEARSGHESGSTMAMSRSNGSYSPRSEEMELSPDEDMDTRHGRSRAKMVPETQRRDRDSEMDMEGEDMYDREHQGSQRQHQRSKDHNLYGTGSELDRAQVVRGRGNIANEGEDEDESDPYLMSADSVRHSQQQQQQQHGLGGRERREDRAQTRDREKEHDRVEEVRMGLKGLQSSLSVLSGNSSVNKDERDGNEPLQRGHEKPHLQDEDTSMMEA